MSHILPIFVSFVLSFLSLGAGMAFEEKKRGGFLLAWLFLMATTILAARFL